MKGYIYDTELFLFTFNLFYFYNLIYYWSQKGWKMLEKCKIGEREKKRQREKGFERVRFSKSIVPRTSRVCRRTEVGVWVVSCRVDLNGGGR